jgi:TrmH family RNA methyltransferase
VIASAQNPTLKYLRSLQRRHTRHQERAFVVEGGRGVADALGTGAEPALIVLREDYVPEHPVILDAVTGWALERTRIVAGGPFDAIAETVSPQGVLAVFPFPDLPIAERGAALFLVVDRVRDPGNLGTLLRAAVGAGATAVFLTAESVDPFNPKAVRAAMGAHFRVPIRAFDADAEALVRASCPLRALTEAAGQVPVDGLDWTQPAAVIVGSEAAGASPETRDLATVRAAIPLLGGVESLNAAVAGAVVLFEAARQRRRGGRRSAPPPVGAGAEGGPPPAR